MPELQRGSTTTSIIDVLDHILDKGIVIDAWMRVALVGIDLITVEARIVVASIDTYVTCAESVGQLAPALAPLNRSSIWQYPTIRPPGEYGSAGANLTTRGASLTTRGASLPTRKRGRVIES
jgi:hypothetical protein